MFSIGQLLRDRRDALSLPPHQVAEQAHVSEEALLAFEETRGTLTAAALDRVARVLAVDPPALREGRIEPQPTAMSCFRQLGTFADLCDVEDQPDVLERCVLEALDRDLITRARARELLGLSPWDDLPTRA